MAGLPNCFSCNREDINANIQKLKFTKQHYNGLVEENRAATVHYMTDSKDFHCVPVMSSRDKWVD